LIRKLGYLCYFAQKWLNSKGTAGERKKGINIQDLCKEK